ncbi:MAG: Gfo/Idh/MocA family oxidoreductase [Lachnospiraceae bacterium]|nr:Gfo/Idh/MocA family oxidoreductase [Lachnospiraceae bacterium]
MRKVGIIGCGSIARVHGWVIREMENAELSAFCDIVEKRAAEIAENYAAQNSCMVETNWRNLLEKDLDVVHICTPHFLHVPMAVEFLRAGKAVFMEKPCSISTYQFEQLKEADYEFPNKLGICFQNRYNYSTKTAAQLADSGEIGNITGARAFVTWRRDEEYYAGSPWKGQIEKEGGGVLINQAIHTLDLMLEFLGKPNNIESSIHNHHLRKISVEDTVEAWMSFPDEKRACFYASNGYAADAPVILELQGESGIITIYGNEVWLKKPDQDTRIFSKKEDSGIGKDYWGVGHKECICDFYRSLEDGTPFKVNLESVKNTFEVMMKIYDR